MWDNACSPGHFLHRRPFIKKEMGRGGLEHFILESPHTSPITNCSVFWSLSNT